MRVLLISPQFLPVPSIKGGAIESLVDEYLKYNSRVQNHNITVYSIYDNNVISSSKKYNSVKFRYIKKNSLMYRFLKIVLFFQKKIRKNKQVPTPYAISIILDLKKHKELNKYDLVIIENQIESVITYCKRIKGYKVEHLHNDYLNINTKQGFEITKICDEFWGVSKFICNQISKINNKCKTKVLYNGIDRKKFNSDIEDSEKNWLYKKIKFKKADYIILYVGRIMPEKGVLELIQSFNKIKTKKDNLRLLIVGKKKNNKKEINNYYDKMLNEKMKNDNSIYFYGNANHNELKIIYNIANLQVIPTLCEEAFGLVLLEGMSAKLPLIVTNSGGMSEVASKNVEIISKERILYELPERIEKMYKQKHKIKQITENYDSILSKFTIEDYCKNFDKYIYNSVEKVNYE